MTSGRVLESAFTLVLAVAVVASFAVSSLGVAIVGTVEAQASPTVDVADGSVVRGHQTNLSVTVDSVPNGFAGGTLTLELDSPEVGKIQAFHGASGLTVLNTTIDQGGDRVTVRIADLDDSVGAGDGPVTLGSIQISGTQTGTTGVSLPSVRLDDDRGQRIQSSTSPGTLSVQSPETPTLRVNTDESTDTVSLSLASAPSGLSGFRITVVADGAQITGASYESFWKETDTTISDDGTTVTVRAIDLDNAVRPGDGTVPLVTVSLDDAEGVTPTVAVHRLTDDTGHEISHTVSKTRNAESPSDSPPSDGGTGSNDDGADTGLSNPGCSGGSGEASKLQQQFSAIGNLLIFLIVAIAIPNGAYGLLEWMTAGSSFKKNRKGKKRIRNTFIALAGASVLKVAVNLVTTALCL